MKTSSVIKKTDRVNRSASSAFTLVEMMVAIAIFSMVILAMVSVQLFGLRVYTLAATKLSATAGGRKTLNAMRDQIRSSKQVFVGNYNVAASPPFTRIAEGLPQTGNSLEIFPTTNNASWSNAIIYYVNSANGTVCSTNAGAGIGSIMANYITNFNNCFELDDFQGNTMTNNQNNPVIHVMMQFSQWEFPIGFVGSNSISAYNYYTLRTKISRRCKQ